MEGPRGRLTLGPLLGLSGALLLGSVQVELLEDARARVVRLDTGQAVTLARARLPRGTREGDVVVDGRLDAALTDELRRSVRERRARLAVPVPGGLELATAGAPPLTGGRER